MGAPVLRDNFLSFANSVVVSHTVVRFFIEKSLPYMATYVKAIMDTGPLHPGTQKGKGFKL